MTDVDAGTRSVEHQLREATTALTEARVEIDELQRKLSEAFDDAVLNMVPRSQLDAAEQSLAEVRGALERVVTAYNLPERCYADPRRTSAIDHCREVVKRLPPPAPRRTEVGSCCHQLVGELEQCRHGFFMGSTCRDCILSCADCWDHFASSASYGPRPTQEPR
jgi:hypothetical protein